MVQILYSPGYGSGWSAGHGYTVEEKIFLLTYPGFIRALELQEQHDEAENEFAFDDRFWLREEERSLSMEMLEACLAAEAAVPEEDRTYFHADHFSRCPYEIVRAFPEFAREWTEKFPNAKHFPWLGGLHQLSLDLVPDVHGVYIKVFDGSETVHYRNTLNEWD